MGNLLLLILAFFAWWAHPWGEFESHSFFKRHPGQQEG